MLAIFALMNQMVIRRKIVELVTFSYTLSIIVHF